MYCFLSFDGAFETIYCALDGALEGATLSYMGDPSRKHCMHTVSLFDMMAHDIIIHTERENSWHGQSGIQLIH